VRWSRVFQQRPDSYQVRIFTLMVNSYPALI
jgi:hypothetical protein